MIVFSLVAIINFVQSIFAASFIQEVMYKKQIDYENFNFWDIFFNLNTFWTILFSTVFIIILILGLLTLSYQFTKTENIDSPGKSLMKNQLHKIYFSSIILFTFLFLGFLFFAFFTGQKIIIGFINATLGLSTTHSQDIISSAVFNSSYQSGWVSENPTQIKQISEEIWTPTTFNSIKHWDYSFSVGIPNHFIKGFFFGSTTISLVYLIMRLPILVVTQLMTIFTTKTEKEVVFKETLMKISKQFISIFVINLFIILYIYLSKKLNITITTAAKDLGVGARNMVKLILEAILAATIIKTRSQIVNNIIGEDLCGKFKSGRQKIFSKFKNFKPLSKLKNKLLKEN